MGSTVEASNLDGDAVDAAAAEPPSTTEAPTESGPVATEAKSAPQSTPRIVTGSGYLAHQSSTLAENISVGDKPSAVDKLALSAATQGNTRPPISNPVALVTALTSSIAPSAAPRVVQPTGYLQAYQQAQQSHNAAIAANQALANARAGMTPNGSHNVMRGHPIQIHNTNRTAMVSASNYAGYQRVVNNNGVSTVQKRGYSAMNGRPASAAGASSTPPQKYIRTTPNGRAPMNNYKNHLHAQDAATRFKAAYNNAGPALVNIVENAAVYFEGKDTPEAIQDKERSYQRYIFNSDLLSEIFEGPLPGEKGVDKVEKNEKTESSGRESIERVMKMKVMEEIGGKMMMRSHGERMAELNALREKYSNMEEDHRKAEKGSMRLFQKIDRATSIDELRRIRAEYEKMYDVTFVEHPPLFEKRELDRSLPHVSLGAEATIVELP